MIRRTAGTGNAAFLLLGRCLQRPEPGCGEMANVATLRLYRLRSAPERAHNNPRYSVTCGGYFRRPKKATLSAATEHLSYCEELVASTSPPVGRGVVSSDA